MFTIKAFPIVLGSSVYTPTYTTGVVPLSLLSSRVRYTGVTREIQYFYDDVFLGETSSVWSSDITGFSPSVTATYLESFARRGIIPRSIYMNALQSNYWYELACDNETYYQFYYEQIDGNFRRGRRKPLALINDEQLFGDWQAPALTSNSGSGTSTLYFASNLSNYSLVNLDKAAIEGLFLQYSGFNISILSITAILGEAYLDNDVVSMRATTENKVEILVEVSDGMSTLSHVVTLEGFTGIAEYVSPIADRESSPDYDILCRVVNGSYFSNLLGSYTTTITLISPYSDVVNTEWYVISGSLDGGVGASAYLTAVDASTNGVIFFVEHIEKGAPIGSGIVIKSGSGGDDNVLVDSEQGATNFIDWFEAPANNTVSKVLDLKGTFYLRFHTSLVGSSPDFSAAELHSVSWDGDTNTVTLTPHESLGSNTRIVITGD